LIIIIYWIISLYLCYIIINKSKKEEENFIILFNFRIPKIIFRKIFHFMAFIMFIPSTLFQHKLMYISYAFAFNIFIILEVLRLKVKNTNFGIFLNTQLKKFIDKRDSGPLILTHIYLLLGLYIFYIRMCFYSLGTK
jgi:dolichol kinase